MSSKKKIHFIPLLIILAFVVFCSSVIYAGVQMMSQEVSMDTENYYEKELEYQEQINREILTRDLDKYLDFELKAEEKAYEITFPVDSLKASTITGEIHFFRPSTSRFDKRIKVQLDDGGRQRIPIHELQQGYWKVKVIWKQGRMEFFDQESFLIPK